MKVSLCTLASVTGPHVVYDVLIHLWPVVFLHDGETYFVDAKMSTTCKAVMVSEECVCPKVSGKSKLVDEFKFIRLAFAASLKEMIQKSIHDTVVLGFRDNFIPEFAFFW